MSRYRPSDEDALQRARERWQLRTMSVALSAVFWILGAMPILEYVEGLPLRLYMLSGVLEITGLAICGIGYVVSSWRYLYAQAKEERQQLGDRMQQITTGFDREIAAINETRELLRRLSEREQQP